MYPLDTLTPTLLGLLAALVPSATAINATATFYGGNIQGGACLLPSNAIPAGVYGVAFSGASWDSSGMCGVCMQVAGPKGSVKAMIVDKCPECKPNGLDLFQNAFAQIAEISAGVIDVEWEQVPCGIQQPLGVRNKEGTSKWWFAMQVVNANDQVKSLQVSTDGGKTWLPTVRKDYNYFQKAEGNGFGADQLEVQVTCANGKQVRLQGVGVAAGTSSTASGNC